MSVKDLFSRNISKMLPATTLEQVAEDVESVNYIREEIIDEERYIPDVDYSIPENFVKFGSAEKYYCDAIERIYNTYPFDGSLYEKKQFENSSSYLDKFIFNKWYPRTNGYIKLCANGWGTGTGTNSFHNLAEPTTKEYIKIMGVMNTGSTNMGANKYDESNNRTYNLKLDGVSGNTIEFWFKKGEGSSDTSQKQVLFDLWNGTTLSHAAGSTYGRMSLILANDSSFTAPTVHLTYVSGTVDVCTFDEIGILKTDDTWNHYAFSIKNNGTSLLVKTFLNGVLSGSTSFALGAINEVTGALKGYIGAIQTAVDAAEVAAGQPALDGYGKLSGSIDEFRFWKVARTDKDIYLNWNTQLGVKGSGGTNTDTSNTDLGVYYKFNEGITLTSSVDAMILDYSGRVSDGAFIGYNANTRSTSSAIVESGYASSEYKDPIIYSFHPDVLNLYTQKQSSGSIYDIQNNASFYRSFPDWMVDEDREDEKTGNLYRLTQIASSYLDTLFLQIQQIPRLREARYITGSFQKALPFANRLLESVGFDTSEIFSDATAMECFLSRNENNIFEKKLGEIKNLIYTNIYNNINYIYKSKGNEKSFRNLIRCYGVDDNLIKINFYGNNVVYDLKTNYRNITTRKKYVDFNDTDRYESTVFQYAKTGETNSVSFISGSESAATGSALTIEAEILFPKKFDSDSSLYFETPFLSSSLFGIHTAKTDNSADTSWATTDYDFQVYAVRDKIDSKHVYFKLTGSYGKVFPLLTSSLYHDVYDNQKWNFSVRIKPSKYPLVDKVSGSLWNTYIVSFKGINSISDYVLNEFEVSSSLTFNQGSQFIISPKRVYVGAHKTNFTSSIIDKSDIKASSVRVWLDYISDEALKSHSFDTFNFGVDNPYENSFLMMQSANKNFIPKMETLALHWDFSNNTGSDSSGNFVVEDISSGSISERTRYNWIGAVSKYYHTGKGYNFPVSNTNVVDVEYIYNAKQKLPEILDSSDMIQILERDDTVFTRDTRPIEFFASIEKSMYQTISEEIINVFSTIKDFNNLIGEPVNRYRQNYKNLQHLKSLYFERVRNTPDVEKYVEFYKWIDSSLTNMIQQIIPLSSNVSKDISNVVESHILERNKYQTKYPTLEMKFNDPESGMRGINELTYNWKFGSCPTTVNQNLHCLYWKEMSLRTDIPLSASDYYVNFSKNMILSSTYSSLTRRFTTPYKNETNEQQILKSGTNVFRNKKVDYLKSVLARSFGSGLGELSVSSSAVNLTISCLDDVGLEKKNFINAKTYNLYENNHIESDICLPFSILSSSVKSGYIKNISDTFMTGIHIADIHYDCYGNDKETPMQSPFTERWVGGAQHRHYAFDGSTTSSEANRREGFRISFDTNNKVMYVKGADTAFSTKERNPKSLCYREGLAKRCVNIKNIKGANYNKEYEIINTSGRIINNCSFVTSGGFGIIVGGSPYLEGFYDYQKPDRGNKKHVFTERFSSPGSPETSGDSNGGIGLDIISAEYSAYNNVNYRNLIVRDPLKVLLTRPCGQFGTDSTLGSVFSRTYETSASFHKVNRNPLERMVFSGSNINGPEAEYYMTGTIYDNWYIQHAIPQDDASYSWIKACSYVSGSSGD